MWSTFLIIIGIINAIFGVLLGAMTWMAYIGLGKAERGLLKVFGSMAALFIINAVVFFVINGVGLCG